MAAETTLTVIGNLTDAPELRYTPTGHALARFTIASTPRTFDRQTGTWRDGDTLFLRCALWRQLAENLAESNLGKGARVIVTGRLRQRNYQTADGVNRTTIELEVDELGPSLRYATATVRRLDRSEVAATGGAEGGPEPVESTEQPPF